MGELKAISLEQLLWWTYHVQRADIVIDRGVGLFDAELAADGIITRKSSADGVYLLSTTGGRVDGGGKARGDLHPDAELVHRMVLAMGRDAQSVIMTYVRLGSAPDPMLNARPRFVPKRDRRGKITVQRTAKREAIATVLELVPSQSLIDSHRRAYAEWFDLMLILSSALKASGKLESHRITGIGANPLPSEFSLLRAGQKFDIPSEGSKCV